MDLDVIPHARPQVSDAEIEAVVAALRAGRLAQGEEVAALERDVSAAFDGAYVVAVSSGTAALALSLRALELSHGAPVVIPSYTCNSLYAAVCATDGEARCVDSGVHSACITRATVAEAAGPADAAIVPHTFGYLADVDGIKEVGRPVIEDCAHAFGGTYADGARIGCKGDIAMVSFYATKMVPAGEGGLCITRRESWARRIRQLRDCDGCELDRHAFNYKMSDIHAALARARLERLGRDVDERQRLAQAYDQAFAARSHRVRSGASQAVCYRYLVSPDGDPDAFMDAALGAAITCRRPVFRPLHESLGGRCPHTDQFHRSMISVPLYPGLTEGEIDRILTVLPRLCAAR